eukprot:m.223024 g.223024  ORF g.223024 m.223024 type:complete len:117 (-) comp13850_c0_seq39:105-455(-)
MNNILFKRSGNYLGFLHFFTGIDLWFAVVEKLNELCNLWEHANTGSAGTGVLDLLEVILYGFPIHIRRCFVIWLSYTFLCFNGNSLISSNKKYSKKKKKKMSKYYYDLVGSFDGNN